MERASPPAPGHRTVLAAVLANVAIAAAKFAVAAVTGSSAILSEAIHSVVDTGDGLLLWLGLRSSQRPPDEMHPFGHGKELYFWTTVVAILVFAVGGGMSAYEGILHLARPAADRGRSWSYVVLGVSAVFEASSWTVAAREFARAKGRRSVWRAIRATKDPLVFTVLLEDGAALAGIAIALAGVALAHATGRAWLDGAASIAIGALLMSVAAVLAREARGLVIGESASPETVADVRRVAAADPAVAGVERALTVHFGPEVVVLNLDLRFRRGLRASDVVEAVARIEGALRRAHPEQRFIFVEGSALAAAAP